MSNEETERVTQLWPVSVKTKVQDRVGQRGVTRYTLEAVREKLARDEAQEVVKEAIGETPAPTPVAVVEREEPVALEPMPDRGAPEVGVVAEPVVHESKLIEGETRGATVQVTTTSTGAAEEYSSSRARVEAMLAKAADMGLKKAAELPVPAPKPVAEISAPDQVAEAPKEEPFDPDAYDEPTPADQLTLQEELAQIKDVPVSALPDAQPVQTLARNLEEIDVDF